MNETPDPLERELLAFRPSALSGELRQRIAGRLADSTAKKNRRFWSLGVIGGLAAACLVALFLGRGGSRSVDTGPPLVGSPTAPSGRPEDALPSLRAYRQALAQSPEAMETLLDRHAAHGYGPDPQLVRIHAFNRPDLEGRTLSGEL